VRGLPITHAAVEALNNTYERALVSMHKMPRIWLEFADFMVGQRWLTRTRRLFDRALCALPITQHDRVWQVYLVRARGRLGATRAPRWPGPARPNAGARGLNRARGAPRRSS
jgi:hypothetical protein